MQDRLKGYERGHDALGISLDKDLIYSPEAFDILDLESPEWRKRAKKTVERLVLENGADAIIASDDIWAAHIIKHLLSIGKSVPRDVGVVGFDNTAIAKIMSPGITSIDQSNQKLAKALLDHILNWNMKKNTEEKAILVKPELIIRESTRRHG